GRGGVSRAGAGRGGRGWGGCGGAVVGVSTGGPTGVSFAAWPMRSRPPATPSRKGAKRGREARMRTLPRRRERGAGGRNP
ncbi:Fis family transcriptional regulator, partial [Burkholderia pseudomallei]